MKIAMVYGIYWGGGDIEGLRKFFGGGRYGWSAEFNIRGIRQNARMKIAMVCVDLFGAGTWMVCGIYLVEGDMDGLRNSISGAFGRMPV